jgi:hypothetical protein
MGQPSPIEEEIVVESSSLFKPYKLRPKMGDCADSNSAKNVPKEHYGEEISLKLAGWQNSN